MLDLKKDYETLKGKPIKLICKEIHKNKEWVFGIVYRSDGTPTAAKFDENGSDVYSNIKIKEVSNCKYKDYKIDDPVLVYDDYDDIKYRAYFAGVNENNKPTTFPHGTTSWTTISNEVISWKYCMRVSL